jgi:hypothetical protein
MRAGDDRRQDRDPNRAWLHFLAGHAQRPGASREVHDKPDFRSHSGQITPISWRLVIKLDAKADCGRVSTSFSYDREPIQDP